MASTRLPGKALLPVGRFPLIHHVIARGKRLRGVDRVILATSAAPENDALEEYAAGQGIEVFRGDEMNVLERFFRVATAHRAEHIVRLTGDNPLLDTDATAFLLDRHQAEAADLTCCVGMPAGAVPDVFSFQAMAASHAEADGRKLHDGVDLHILEHPERFKIKQFKLRASLADYRWSIDTPEDMRRMKRLFTMIGDAVETMNSADLLKTITRLGLDADLRPAAVEISAMNAYTIELLDKIPFSAIALDDICRATEEVRS